MELNYKVCKLTDLEQLIELSKSTFKEAFEKDNNPLDFQNYIEKAFARKTLEREMTNKDTQFFFVYDKKNVVAYFKLNIGNAQTDVKLNESMELERIYVLPQYQGAGLGEHILSKVKKMALLQHKTMLWLGVWEKNERAIRFYQRQGFEKFATHPYFIGQDEQTDWLMRFELSTL